MIPNGELYLAVKKLSALLKEITSNHIGDFFCSKCFHLFWTKNKLEAKKKCKNKDFCGVLIHSEDTETLEFNQYQKSDETLPIIYADLESLIK